MSDFSTPAAAIGRAFHRIAGDIYVRGWWARTLLRRRLSSAFQAAHTAGDSRAAQRTMGALLHDQDWRWPFFDRAADEFRTQGIWPIAWNRDGLPPSADWADVPHQKRIWLLVLALDHASYADRDRDQHFAMVRDKALPRGWYQYLEPGFPGCLAEQLMIERHGNSIRRGDPAASLPPYFPGDGLSLRTHIPRQRRR